MIKYVGSHPRPAKPKSYPIRVEGVLCTGPGFALQGWVHEVTCLEGVPRHKKKMLDPIQEAEV
jgi:hypothetical protein